ncbi:MAG TPA: amino acid permease [Steroidobacter sp.]|uniref:APC family permease n=1 Tax=Steroidobacter sp. TaxID=1978227 RepID=UPI002ED84191
MTSSASNAGALPQRLGVWSAATIVVGIIVGSGIFRVPSSIAALTGSTGTMALLWILGGLITLCLALSLAELAAMYPRSGGNYVYLREAYGPGVAFVYGWTFLLINPAVWAGISLILAEYLGHFVPLDSGEQRLAAAAVIAFASVANCFSVRFAVAIQNIATAAKAAALFAVAGAIFALGSTGSGSFNQPVTFDAPSYGSLGVALVSVLFAYEGVVSFCALSGEVRDPDRSLPRALTLGVLLVILLYLVINAAYLYVLPLESIISSKLVAADAIQKVAGSAGAGIVAALVILTTFGAVMACAIADPRVFYAMAQDGQFFRAIGVVHPKLETPYLAVLLSGAIAIAYSSLHSFEELTAIFILGLWPFYALGVLGVIVLRLKQPQLARPYRTPCYPLVPAIFLAASSLVLVNSLIEQPRVTLLNLSITLAGVPVYYIWRKFGLRRAAAKQAQAT